MKVIFSIFILIPCKSNLMSSFTLDEYFLDSSSVFVIHSISTFCNQIAISSTFNQKESPHYCDIILIMFRGVVHIILHFLFISLTTPHTITLKRHSSKDNEICNRTRCALIRLLKLRIAKVVIPDMKNR